MSAELGRTPTPDHDALCKCGAHILCPLLICHEKDMHDYPCPSCLEAQEEKS